MDLSRAKTISFSAKCGELFSARLREPDGKTVAEMEEKYVPCLLGGGDYVELEIDLATGKVVNWLPPTTAQLEEIFRP